MSKFCEFMKIRLLYMENTGYQILDNQKTYSLGFSGYTAVERLVKNHELHPRTVHANEVIVVGQFFTRARFFLWVCGCIKFPDKDKFSCSTWPYVPSFCTGELFLRKGQNEIVKYPVLLPSKKNQM